MRARRILVILAATAGALLTAPIAASADVTYPTEPPEVTTTAGTVAAGNSFVFHGTGFWPLEMVTISLEFADTDSSAMAPPGAVRMVPMAYTVPLAGSAPDTAAMARRINVIATAQADEIGSFDVTLDLPHAGTAVISAVGVSSGRTSSMTVHVVASGDRKSVV